MAINAPRYALVEERRLGRRDRIWACFSENFRHEVANGWSLAIILLAMVVTIVPLLLTVFAYQTLGDNSPLALAAFYQPYGGLLILLMIMLMSALVGGGIVASDLGTKAISLYLSRPITLEDYLLSKGGVVAASLALVAVVPGMIAAILAYILGYVGGTVAAEALGAYIAMGILLTAVFSALSLFLSSLAEKKTWASAGIFAFILIDEIVAEALWGITHNQNWLYMSPWEDLTAVANWLFNAGSASVAPNAGIAAAVVLFLTGILGSVTYLRLSRMELVTE